MGATGTEKSRLSVDVATHFGGEMINSDKMQVYKGLEIVTNKITHAEKQGVRHYLLGEIEPDSDFTAEDFCLQAVVYIEKIQKTQRVPIIVGGSNSYIGKLVEDPVFMFKWLVDELVDEVRQIFIPDADYSKGIRRSIGVPEMDRYFREETNIDGDDESKQMILQASISSIKRNTDKMSTFINNEEFNKKKVIFIMGATGTGKSRLSVDIATHFGGNSGKMQVYKGLEIVTNKITHAEKQGVRHYLLGEIEPDSDFTAEDFCLQAVVYIEKILKTQRIPNI
ncbi:adenylate isopentenyltransferase 5, chloroplastic-like [Solanum lycopersicum]|uniref:adenylate isopentenyltransferase 5, chloroplastic-like n=1 Tax=Solanum lycopersicum TaxID=4081 RepID=UPI0037486030